jgi:hypothetical protein
MLIYALQTYHIHGRSNASWHFQNHINKHKCRAKPTSLSDCSVCSRKSDVFIFIKI